METSQLGTIVLTAFVTTGIWLGGKIIFDWLQKRTNGKSEHINGRSGDKPASYWTQAIGEVVDKALERRNLVIKDIVRQVVREEFERLK